VDEDSELHQRVITSTVKSVTNADIHCVYHVERLYEEYVANNGGTAPLPVLAQHISRQPRDPSELHRWREVMQEVRKAEIKTEDIQHQKVRLFTLLTYNGLLRLNF
jgi:hypothetical protein